MHKRSHSRQLREDSLMMSAALLVLLTAPAAAQSVQFPPKGSAQQRADYERGQSNQIAFEQKLFVAGGFEPLEAVDTSQRSVKRALFEAPYIMLPVPGVEIERAANGSVTLTVVDRASSSAPATLSSAAWDRLTSLQGALFRQKPYVPWDPPAVDEAESEPPPICHGWIVRFGTMDDTGKGSGSWAQCGGKDQPELAYAVEMAKLAVSTRPTCKFDDRNPFGSFSACFAPQPGP